MSSPVSPFQSALEWARGEPKAVSANSAKSSWPTYLWTGFFVALLLLAAWWWWVNWGNRNRSELSSATLDNLKQSAQKTSSRLTVGPDGIVNAN